MADTIHAYGHPTEDPKDYVVTLKLEIYVDYPASAFDEEQALIEAMKDARVDLPVGWHLADYEMVEAYYD